MYQTRHLYKLLEHALPMFHNINYDKKNIKQNYYSFYLYSKMVNEMIEKEKIFLADVF